MAKLDLSVLIKVLGQQNLKSVNGDLAKIDTQADKTQGKMASAFNPKNLLLGGGVAFAATQAVGFLNDAAKKASDLEEAQSKVNVVFGEGSDQVTKWAEGSAEGFLLSKQAALEAAGTYGNLFQAFGIGRESATEMSTTLVELAADMASFNNTSVDDALVALRSGLSGETEPLKRYGVALNDVRLRQKALELGIYNGVGALNAGQKAQASYNLILEDTALAQGDVERTGDNLANQQRQMAADIENAEAEIGKAWASIQLGAIKVGRSLGELVDQTGEDFGDIASFFSETQDWGQIFGEQREAVGRQMTAMERETQASALAAVRAVEVELKKGGPVIAAEAGKIGGMLPAAIQDQVDEMKTAGEDIMGPNGLAGGILAGQQKPEDAITELKRVMKESLSETEQIAHLTGEDALWALNEGLNSPLLVDRLSAHEAIVKITDQLNALGPAGAAAAAALLNSLNLGLQAPDPLAEIRQSALRLAGIMTAPLMRSEPKDPRSPMRGMTHWGEDYIDILASDIEANLGTAASAARALSGALVPSVSGAQGALPGLPVGSGGTTNIYLQWEGEPPKGRSESEIVSNLQRLLPVAGY